MFEDFKVVYINITQGGHYEESWYLTDETGTRLPFTTDGDWAGRAQFRTSIGGAEVLTLDSDSGTTPDGTITFEDDDDNLTFTLLASVTAALDPTVDDNGRQTGYVIGDLEIWRTSAPTVRYKAMPVIYARVFPEVTTS